MAKELDTFLDNVIEELNSGNRKGEYSTKNFIDVLLEIQNRK